MAEASLYVLRGHRSDVNTMCLNDDTNVLVSGSEDGFVRLWDLERERRSFKCAKRNEGAITSVSLDPSNEMNLFVAAGKNIYQYDLRVPNVVMTSTEATFGFKSRRKKKEIDELPDEINRVDCHRDGTLIVAASDSGETIVFDVKKSAQGLRPRYVHSNICTAVEWRPNTSRHVYTSGAMDCSVIGWDYDIKREFGHIEMNSAAEKKSSQLFNPPFVHSLAYSGDGKIFAAALGDGTVGVYDANTYESACVEETRLEGHNTATCEVKFSRFDMKGVYGLLSACQSESILFRRLCLVEDAAADDDNDGIVVKDTSEKTTNSTSASPQSKKSHRRRKRKKKKKKKREMIPAVKKLKSEIVLRLNHSQKINCLETTKSGHVIVADTSSEIHIYSGLISS